MSTSPYRPTGLGALNPRPKGRGTSRILVDDAVIDGTRVGAAVASGSGFDDRASGEALRAPVVHGGAQVLATSAGGAALKSDHRDAVPAPTGLGASTARADIVPGGGFY